MQNGVRAWAMRRTNGGFSKSISVEPLYTQRHSGVPTDILPAANYYYIIIIYHHHPSLLLKIIVMRSWRIYIYLCARIVKHDNALMYVLFTLLCPRPSRHNIIIHRPSHMKRRWKRWFPGHKDGLSCAPCKLYRLCMVDGIRLKMWLLTHIALRLRTDVANFRFRTNSKQ